MLYLTFHPIFSHRSLSRSSSHVPFLSCFRSALTSLVIFDSSSRTHCFNTVKRARMILSASTLPMVCLTQKTIAQIYNNSVYGCNFNKTYRSAIETYCNIYRHMTICIHVIFHDVIYSLSKAYHCIAHFNDKKKKYDRI